MRRTSAIEQAEVDVDVAPAATGDAMEGLIMEEGRNAQPPQALVPQPQAQFSLAPAIYTPFHGFDDLLDSDDEDLVLEFHVNEVGNVIQPTHVAGKSTEEAPEKPVERNAENTIEKATNRATEEPGQDVDSDVNKAEPNKIETIVAKIKRQQEFVKDNMIYLTEIRLQNLQNQAQHRVEQVESGDWDDENPDTAQGNDEREEKLTGKVWERLSANALGEDEAELGEFVPGRDMDREIMEELRDVELGRVKSRAVKAVFEELKREVAEVIEGAILEVEVYGEHAEKNLERYKPILAERIMEIDSKDLGVLVESDTVMGGVESTKTAADAHRSVLSPAFGFRSSI